MQTDDEPFHHSSFPRYYSTGIASADTHPRRPEAEKQLESAEISKTPGVRLIHDTSEIVLSWNNRFKTTWKMVTA